MPELSVLTEDDVSILKMVVERERQRLAVAAKRDTVIPTDPMGAVAYVALIPPGGIAGLPSGSSTPSFADCMVQRVADGVIEQIDGYDQRVYNLSSVDAAAGSYVRIVRDQYGVWATFPGGGSSSSAITVIDYDVIEDFTEYVEGVLYFNSANGTIVVNQGGVWYVFCVCDTGTGTGTGGSSSILIRTVDGTPSGTLNELRVEELDGFVLTHLGANVWRLEIADASVDTTGVVNRTTQTFRGRKTFIDGANFSEWAQWIATLATWSADVYDYDLQDSTTYLVVDATTDVSLYTVVPALAGTSGRVTQFFVLYNGGPGTITIKHNNVGLFGSAGCVLNTHTNADIDLPSGGTAVFWWAQNKGNLAIDTTAEWSVYVPGIAFDGSVTNTKLADMPAWTYKIRNGSSTGDPSDAAVADFTTEATPAAGDYAIGFLSTGEIVKYDVSTLSGAGYDDGDAQDAIGAILQDTATIVWTYTAGVSIEANVDPSGIDHADLGAGLDWENSGHVPTTTNDTFAYFNTGGTASEQRVTDFTTYSPELEDELLVWSIADTAHKKSTIEDVLALGGGGSSSWSRHFLIMGG